MIESLPATVTRMFQSMLACELTTIDDEGIPVTTPMAPAWLPDERVFLLATAVSTPAKLARIRRNDRVAMLFSDFTGSGLASGPHVLVQGTATVTDQVHTVRGLEPFWRKLLSTKPDIRFAVTDEATRATAPEWFYWRAGITVVPLRVWALTGPVGDQRRERVA